MCRCAALTLARRGRGEEGGEDKSERALFMVPPPHSVSSGALTVGGVFQRGINWMYNIELYIQYDVPRSNIIGGHNRLWLNHAGLQR